MPSANTKRIEESATTALKAALLRCPILDSYIDSNDKTPSWDGTVFVYKSEKTKKENLAGRVPIQIKGTEKVIVSDTATFSCSVADLNNYYKDGGCVFFLISVDLSSGNSRIFYKTLLVVDLDKIIKGAGKQKTSTIHLNLFPTAANEISSIFMEFTDNVHKQMGFIGKDIPTFESLEASGAEITSLTFTASGIGLTLDEIPKFLSTHDFYLYAKVKGLDVDVPIDKVTNAIISKPVDGEVRIKDRCFFSAYRVVYENGNPMIGAYDEQAKHDEKLLNLAERICDWLKSIESMIDPEVLLLNKLQITKRRRTLSTSEIIELAKLTENSYPPATRCGAYLLMDADEEAQKCFDELPLIAQEEFLKYPICHFGKLTTKEDSFL